MFKHLQTTASKTTDPVYDTFFGFDQTAHICKILKCFYGGLMFFIILLKSV